MSLRKLVKSPDMFVIEWGVAWKTAAGTHKSTTFWTQEARPYMHFTYLVKGAERMFHTSKPTWPHVDDQRPA